MTSDIGVRSFIDLRAFAADAETTDDFLAAGRALSLPEGPVAISALRLAGGGRVAAMPADMFVIVLADQLTIDDVTLSVGHSLVLPAGAGFAWDAGVGALAVTMRCAGGATGAGRPIVIDETTALEPSAAPLAALLVGDTPACRNHTDYRSANGEFVCGIWDSTPYHPTAMRYGHHELMHLIEGSVSFEDETGRSATFAAGDVFLVEQGAECSWRSTDHVKKVYAIYRPAA